MTIEAVAATAGVGKPAIYRRYPDKAALATAVIASQLQPIEVPDLGDTRAELWLAVDRGFPADGPSYVRLIGGLIAEEERHPELIAAFRERILLPRRETVAGLIERGQRRGEIRSEVEPEAAVDSLAGPLLARVFAGVDTGRPWRTRAFEIWWQSVKERKQ
jgi:AcrR family transcriptional regulator